jgi:DNA-binding transcriptional ArsR family regulator
MTEELFDAVAERFKGLAEPARLRILDALRHGELTVGELGEKTGLNQANLSKHLQLLHTLEFVTRRKEGLFVYYNLASIDVFRLCDLMCGRLSSDRRRRARARAGNRRRLRE